MTNGGAACGHGLIVRPEKPRKSSRIDATNGNTLQPRAVMLGPATGYAYADRDDARELVFRKFRQAGKFTTKRKQ
ncbi:hypothetical protein [Burkholderia territorii]|uniref:hypothetical protein n=1 Tax=Burkholderia territorii TaxID=1503055 RepID=UPI000AD90326|nr:hypothetical protein [Burkholderia territorii]